MRSDEAGEAQVKRMALDDAEERARLRRGPCTPDSPTQCTSPGLSFCTLIVDTYRHIPVPLISTIIMNQEKEMPSHEFQRVSSERTNSVKYIVSFSTSNRR